MVAVNSPTRALGLPSLKRATVALNVAPSVALTEEPEACRTNELDPLEPLEPEPLEPEPLELEPLEPEPLEPEPLELEPLGPLGNGPLGTGEP